MQGKAILASNTPTTKWAVVGHTSYASAQMKKDPFNNLKRGHVRCVTIIDPGNQYYTRQVYNSTSDQREWTVAPASERSKGFLVESVDSGDRWVVKSNDFVGLWNEFETVWAAKEATAEQERAEQERRNAIRAGEDARVRATNERLTVSLADSLRTLLGDATPVEVNLSVEGLWNEDYSSYRAQTSGRVTINARDFQRLLEAVYEAREAVNQ